VREEAEGRGKSVIDSGTAHATSHQFEVLFARNASGNWLND
jgi:hypothetical protein